VEEHIDRVGMSGDLDFSSGFVFRMKKGERQGGKMPHETTKDTGTLFKKLKDERTCRTRQLKFPSFPFISSRIKKGESRGGTICHAKTMLNRKANEALK